MIFVDDLLLSANGSLLSGRLLGVQGFNFVNRQPREQSNIFVAQFLRSQHCLCNFNIPFSNRFIPHFFHCSAHSCHSFRILLKVLYSLCKHRIEHILCIGTEKIVHQFSNVRIITILAIHIQNMSSIFKRQAQCQVYVLNDIYRFSSLIVIFFRNEKVYPQ